MKYAEDIMPSWDVQGFPDGLLASVKVRTMEGKPLKLFLHHGLAKRLCPVFPWNSRHKGFK
jgi:hypothetical protein